MKTKAFPVACVVLGLVGLSSLTGRASEPAAPPVANTNAPSVPAVDPPLAVSPGTSTVAPTNAPLAMLPAQRPALPPGVQAVVDMAQAHVGDAVLLEFIKGSTSSFQLNADEIVYVRDLGLSEEVITAMIRHGGEPSADASVPAPAPATFAPPAPAPDVAAPATPVYATPMATEAPPPTVVEPAVTYSTYYDALAPYGSWVDLPAYGWCWQPTCSAVDVGWQPYCQGGHWVYTSCGWYWASDYSWGWAPFHYGRWYRHPSCGWVWVPGSVWGPAWVTWRSYGNYCGWAPLPPEAGWTAGVGLTWHGSHFGAGFGFGLGWNCFAFVGFHDFCGPRPYQHLVPRREVVGIYNHSTVINNITIANNTVANHGLAPSRISAVTRQEIRPVELRDLPSRSGVGQRAEVPIRNGSQLAVYRPTIRPDAKPTPPAQALKNNATLVKTSIVANQPMPSRRLAGPAAARTYQPPARQAGSSTLTTRSEAPVTSRSGSTVTPRASTPVSRPTVVSSPTTRTTATPVTSTRIIPDTRSSGAGEVNRGEVRRNEVSSPTYAPSKFATAPQASSTYQQPVSVPAPVSRAPAYQAPSYQAPAPAPAYPAPARPSAPEPRAPAGPAPSRGSDTTKPK